MSHARHILLLLLVFPLACSRTTEPLDSLPPSIPIDIPSPDESTFAELRDFTVVGYFDPPLTQPGDIRIELFAGYRAFGEPVRVLQSHVDPVTGVTPRSALRFAYAQGMAWGPSGAVSDTTVMVMTPDLVADPGGLFDPSNKVVVTHDYFAAVILGGVSRDFDTRYGDAGWRDLTAGNYTLRVSGVSGELAGGSQTRHIVFGRTHAMLGRFAPPEHKQRLLDYAAARRLRTYLDFFPGFFAFDGYAYEIPGRWMPNNSIEVVNASAEAMVDDVARAANDLLLYNISEGSATHRIEIGALAANRRIESSLTTFHHYALGEPSLSYSELPSAIVDFAHGDRLQLTRIETEPATRPLSENLYDPADTRPRTLHAELAPAIPWAADGLFVVFGVVTPIPSATHPGDQPSQQILENSIATIHYSFHAQSADGALLHAETREVGLTRIFGAAQSSSAYEFEHEFDAATLDLPPGDYVLLLECRDSQDIAVAGGRESLQVEILAVQ